MPTNPTTPVNPDPVGDYADAAAEHQAGVTDRLLAAEPTNVKTPDPRAEFLAGLRALADFYQAHPDFPSDTVRLMAYATTAERFAELQSMLGGHRAKGGNDDYRFVTRSFGGGVELQVFADRQTVCTKRVVGTETVEVPDPDAPKVTVERDVVEWDCGPVLAAVEARS